MNAKQGLFSFAASTMLLAGALFSVATPAAAQNWPTKPVRIIVPFTPGGTADTLGRLVAQKLAENLKQPFVVENRGGAGGVIGADLVAKAAPDGYTLVISGVATHAIAPSVSKKGPYDPLKDFTHIALFGGPPNVLAISANVRSPDLKSFIAYAKSNAGKTTYGSPGRGTQGHLFAEHLKQLAGIQLVHVPYKGAGPAMTDLAGGHVDAVSSTLSSAAAQIRSGKARGLAVSSPSRVAEFPHIPTFAELGFAELTTATWFSLSGPAGMPRDIVQRLNREVRQILQLPEVREKLQAEAIEPGNLDPEAFTAFVAKEIKRWEPVVGVAGLQAD